MPRRLVKVLATQLLIIAFLPGCATPSSSEYLDDIPAAKRAEIEAMPEIGDKELSTQPHETLGKVEGVSCKRSYWGSAPSWEATVQRTKYEAMKKGANAIANLACGLPEGRSYFKLCFDSIRCTADAVRLRN
jgi:hypothetical protein